MKTVQLFFISSLFCATCAFSQSKVKFGVKGGLNLANGQMVDNTDKKIRTLFYIGGFAESSLPIEKLKIQTELLYSLMGAKWESEDEDGWE